MSVVTEMSELSVTSFTASTSLCAPGEDVTIIVKIKNISGSTIKLWSVGIGVMAQQFTTDSGAWYFDYVVGDQADLDSISWAAGKSKTFTWIATIPETAVTPFLTYGIRAVPLVLRFTSGTTNNLSSDIYVADSVTVLNTRFNPKIEDFDVKRAINGSEDDEGVNLITTLRLSQDSYSSDYVFDRKCMISYAPQDGSAAETNINLTSRIPELLNGVEGRTDIITSQFSTGLAYDFFVVYGDEYESEIGSDDISYSFANFALSEYGAGASFGMFPSSTPDKPILESAYRFYAYDGIDGVNVYLSQVVKTGGVWIDGKPIYRITMTIPVLKAATSYFGTPLTDCDTVVDIKGIFTLNNGRCVSVNYYYSETYYSWVIVNADNTVEVKSGGRPGTMYVTIEYTKTTDGGSS